MKKSIIGFIFASFFWGCFYPAGAKEQTPERGISVSLNLLQWGLYGSGSAVMGAFGLPLTYVPLHFDLTYPLNADTDLNLGVVYRYEHYHDSPFLERTPTYRIWQNHHDLFVTLGTRTIWSRNPQANEVAYWGFGAGWGMSQSPEYRESALLLRPHFGVERRLPFKGWILNYGAGLIVSLPVSQNTLNRVGYKADWDSLSPLGYLVHRLIPVLNIGLAYEF